MRSKNLISVDHIYYLELMGVNLMIVGFVVCLYILICATLWQAQWRSQGFSWKRTQNVSVLYYHAMCICQLLSMYVQTFGGEGG